ncbi:hypothetical protein [Micromonospora globispora]|uniref:hypothetical protein n=1 Tax=Micromonospora globispora TaxID=1450148 RepID=UPI0021AB5156|nr:hypothetical protein [Micromonospora globispora]
MADHTECGVAGVDQFAGGFHDVAQYRVEVIGAGDRQVGLQQTPQPALGVLHVAGSCHQLLEQFVQLQPGHLREHHPRGGITDQPCGAGAGLAPADILTHVHHRPEDPEIVSPCGMSDGRSRLCPNAFAPPA